MESARKERFIRWNNIRLEQLSFSINLFLGFSVASLAYAINLKLTNTQNAEILIFIIKFWSWSAAFGCAATVSRLFDFRFTAAKIRTGKKSYSCIAKQLGSLSWGLYWSQLLTYVFGAYCFISSIVIT